MMCREAADKIESDIEGLLKKHKLPERPPAPPDSRGLTMRDRAPRPGPAETGRGGATGVTLSPDSNRGTV